MNAEIHKERLHKYLAGAGVASRRAAENLILQGRVTVNGETVSELGTKVVPGKDVVCVDGKLIELQSKYFYLFHKPRGVLSTMRDTHGRRCIRDYTQDLPGRVFPVGRLDFDVCGLLLLTNDGEISERLLHPRYGFKRVYWARVKGRVSEETLSRLTKGITLDDGRAKAFSARRLRRTKKTQRLLGQVPEDSALVEIVVCVGKKHFVKRFLEAAGHPVERLARVEFGPFSLGNLKPGELEQVRFYEKFVAGG